MDETITISVAEYMQLKENTNELYKLYAAGVDNWEWYEEALKTEIEYDG